MRAMTAKGFTGYDDLQLTDLPEPELSGDRVLVRVTAAGVTPLDHTILSGHFPMANAPLVLGNEGAGLIEAGGDASFPNGARAMFTGPYGVLENGSYSELVAVKREHLCLIPDNIDDVAAAGMPVAYLTAFLALRAAGFAAGKSVLAPAIGGSVGNAVTQLSRALGARHAISTTSSSAKARQAVALGFSDVIDLSQERLTDGVRRLTNGYGADIVVDSVGGDILSQSLEILAADGNLITLGYAAGRSAAIDVTNLIWKNTAIKGFLLFSQPPAAWREAWIEIARLLRIGSIKPIVAATYPLEDAAKALKHLMEERPFGRVVLKI